MVQEGHRPFCLTLKHNPVEHIVLSALGNNHC